MKLADRFFGESKQAAAVLKHGVLKRYLATFAGKVSRLRGDRRVGYLDAYAGEGRYVNPVNGASSPGSPLIALGIASDLASRGVQLECVFVEKQATQYASLSALVGEHGYPQALTYQGSIQKRLGECLPLFEGVPLLVLLDPFGTALDTETLVDSILNRGGNAPTEVLLNFSVDSVRRIGARIYEPKGSLGRKASLDRMDRWLGGRWWRKHFWKLQNEPTSRRATQAADAVFAAYVERVAKRTGCGYSALPIRRQAGHLPIFMLTLFFRGHYSAFPFNEAISMASADWRSHLHDADYAAAELSEMKQPPLPSLSLMDELRMVFEHDEHEIHSVLSEQIAAAIVEALNEKESVSVQREIEQVFGGALGTGRERHLRAAWKELAARGVVNAPPKGKLEGAVIYRATPQLVL